MTRFAKQFPILGLAIANAIFIEDAKNSSILIISFIIFLAGYIIFKIVDIFGFCDEGILFSDSLKIVGLIILLCIYCTIITVIMTNQIAFVPLALIDIISGYAAAYFRYDNDDFYDDDDSENNKY